MGDDVEKEGEECNKFFAKEFVIFVLLLIIFNLAAAVVSSVEEATKKFKYDNTANIIRQISRFDLDLSMVK